MAELMHLHQLLTLELYTAFVARDHIHMFNSNVMPYPFQAFFVFRPQLAALTTLQFHSVAYNFPIDAHRHRFVHS